MSAQPPWKVVKATGGVTFIEGPGSKRFALNFDEGGEAEALAAELNRLSRRIADLNQLNQRLTKRETKRLKALEFP